MPAFALVAGRWRVLLVCFCVRPCFRQFLRVKRLFVPCWTLRNSLFLASSLRTLSSLLSWQCFCRLQFSCLHCLRDGGSSVRRLRCNFCVRRSQTSMMVHLLQCLTTSCRVDGSELVSFLATLLLHSTTLISLFLRKKETSSLPVLASLAPAGRSQPLSFLKREK